jgi:DNA-directed RNA polymerase specialized sigma24 family protein
VVEDFAKRSDGELLSAAKADPQAFSEFYRRHAVAVERWLRPQTPDLATAADLTAETFAQALISLNRFLGTNDDQAITWLFAIARNQVRRF